MDEVSLVLLVHEKPGISATGKPPGVGRKLASRLMFFPIFDYDDGYGWTYGARTSIVDVAGKGTRLSVPLSWGATRRAAVEVDRTFKHGPFTHLSSAFGITQRENPHFDIDDQRTSLNARAERRFVRVFTVGADVERTRIEFSPVTESFWTTGADATVDTRRDPSYPSDAVMTTVAWNRLNPIGSAGFSEPIDRYRVDARGYKRLFGQNVLALRVEYDTASAPLPPYEKWLLGGSSLRGTSAGTFAGDKRLLAAAEIRVPFSSPLSTGRTGFNVFIDAGKTAAYDERLSAHRPSRGVGAGLWLTVAIFNLNLDVAHSLDGHGTRVHFGTGFTF